MNAQPSRGARAATTSDDQRAGGDGDGGPRPGGTEYATCAHTAHAAGDDERERPTTARRTRRRAPRMSPSDLRARNTAPCVRNSSSVVSAAEQRERVEQGQKPAEYWWSASSSTPRTRLANATPHSIDGHPRADDQRTGPSGRQRSSSILPRYSNATTRTIRATQDEQQRRGRSRRTSWRTTRGTPRTWRRRR